MRWRRRAGAHQPAAQASASNEIFNGGTSGDHQVAKFGREGAIALGSACKSAASASIAAWSSGSGESSVAIHATRLNPVQCEMKLGRFGPGGCRSGRHGKQQENRCQSEGNQQKLDDSVEPVDVPVARFVGQVISQFLGGTIPSRSWSEGVHDRGHCYSDRRHQSRRGPGCRRTPARRVFVSDLHHRN